MAQATQLADASTQVAPKLDLSTKLAFDRTWAAYERTMLAWVRTGTSLITFGFSVYKFFDIVRSDYPHRQHLITARQFGMILVSIGLASLLLATIEYRQSIRMLGAQYEGLRPRSLAVIVAALISVLGIAAFVVMIARA